MGLLVCGQHAAGGHVKAARGADARGAVHRLGKLLLGSHRAGKDAGERIRDVENLKEALDAAVLAIAAVQGWKGDVVPPAGQFGREVLLGYVIEVYLRKPGGEKCLATLGARLHRDVPLVRPAARKHGNPEVLELLSLH